jgi:hypothetical protein
VDVDEPIANLPDIVRETLPNAVHVERLRPKSNDATAPLVSGLGPTELFAEFYRSARGRGREPSNDTMALFRDLLEEESRETAEA